MEQLALLNQAKPQEKPSHRKISEDMIRVNIVYPEMAATDALDTKLIKKGRFNR